MLVRIIEYVCNYFVVELKVMSSREKKIAIYLYDIRNRNVGLGEFAYPLQTEHPSFVKTMGSSLFLLFLPGLSRSLEMR